MTATRQVALVTGASSGIGKAAAIALAAAGFQVIGTGRNTARVTAPAGVTYLDLDVTSDESVASVVKQVIDRFGHIDVLVNNAGVGANGAAEEFSVARTQDVFDINVYGIMRMTKAVLPHMRAQRRGRVINVSSLSGFVPSPFMAIYTSTKHAVEGYSGSLDHEVREHGVRILLVEPGPINTPFGDHSVQGDTPMPLYASGRRTFDEVLAKNTSGGDDPAVVAKVIVAAATDRNPKLRRTAGSTAASISALHRVASGPDLRPHHPQIQPDAELIAPLVMSGILTTTERQTMTSEDKTGLEIEEHGTTLIVRIDGGEHALLDPGMAAQLGRLVDRADKDPSIHAVVFTGAHPDRFLSHSDVTWLQKGGVGFPPINTRIAGLVSRMARAHQQIAGCQNTRGHDPAQDTFATG